jgi:tetratricopeptide (TPR) repeat protein
MIATYEHLRSLSTLGDMPNDAALNTVGLLADLSHDHRSEDGLVQALTLADELRRRDLTPQQDALLWYFIGNVWGYRRILRVSKAAAQWEWNQPDAYQEVLAFRRALNRKTQLDPVRCCQVATNLGNLMSNLGRVVEAVNYYGRVLGDQPDFGMALGNLGLCLLSYAGALYDPGHQRVFAAEASRLLERAIALPLEPGAREGFVARLVHAKAASGDGKFDLGGFSLGEGAEAAFRAWALRERLFLNPLNDIGPFDAAARDVLHLPPITVTAEKGTGFHGFYNQLKQEFATARVLLFEAAGGARHFADNDLMLLDTLDATSFGYDLERTKLAFRSAYSILDKVAVFIAIYFDLQVPLHRVTFRSLWFSDGQAKRGVRAEFVSRPNLALRGLFWLAKDLSEDDDEFHDAMEPGAQELATLRNRLEHQYVKVTDGPSSTAAPPDPFAYRVDRKAFTAKALLMLKMARTALTYLSLAVHSEERRIPPSAGRGTVRGSLAVIK